MSATPVRFLLLILLVCAAQAADKTKPGAATLTAEGIALPFFDANGKLTHRLIAKGGVMTGTSQAMRGVELVYYSLKDPNVVVQKLVAADAVWDPNKETLTGRGPIEVTTPESRLTGEGFDFTLATALLHIHRAFTMSHPDLRLTSDRATVELVMEQKGDERKVRDVKRCEAIGNLHIVVQPAARARYNVEEAWSPRGIYDGATEIITFPEPTRYLVKGKTVEAKQLEITLARKPEL